MHAHTEPVTDTTTDLQPEPGATSPVDIALATIRPRLMIPVADLTAHPGNVRDDLNLSQEFCASIAAEGVRIPLLITPAENGGGWLVIEGHRRLAAAAKAGLAEVPCDIDPGRAADEAGQYLDMLLANSDAYRSNFTVVEEAAALFAAHAAGASRTRLRKATGRTAAQVKTAIAAGSLPAGTKARAAEASPDLTLDDLALLAEFEGDDDATSRLLASLEHGYPLDHVAERIRRDRAEAAEHARIRGDLEASGVLVTDRLPDGAAWLTSLTHDGQDLAPETHAACPGNGVTFTAWNLLEPAWYCASPAEQGHASRWLTGGSSVGTSGVYDADGSVWLTNSEGTSGAAGNQPAHALDPGRRLVIAGNKAWQAAAGVRHRWLTGSFFVMLAPVITAYEHAMTDAEKRAELRLMQHSARGDIGVSAGRKGAGRRCRNVIGGPASTACAGPLPTQQCCI